MRKLLTAMFAVMCLVASTASTAVADDFDTTSDCVGQYSDEFEGASFDTEKWSYRWGGQITPPALPTVSNGVLNFQIGSWNVDLDRTGPMHFIGQPLPEGDFTAEAKISAPNLETDSGSTGSLQYAQVGLMIYQNDDYWAKVDRTRNADGNGNTHTQFESAHETAQVRQLGTRTPGAPGLSGATDPPGNFWGIRLSVQGGQLSGAYTLNPDAANPTWNEIPWPQGGGGSSLDAIMPPSNGPRYLGIFGGSGVTVTSIDWFRVTPDEPGECEDTTPPTVSASTLPANPDGTNNWFRSNPSVTLTATDNESDPENITIEYDLGQTGTFVEYDGSFVVEEEGEVSIDYRATDEAGNTSDVETLTVKVDTEPPTVNHTFTPADGPYVAPGPVTLNLAAIDATSGVNAIRWHDGLGWQTYNPGSRPMFTDPGAYSIDYWAEDNAGNTTEVQTALFEILSPPPELSVKAKKKLTLKGKKAGKLKVKVTNTGESDASATKVCVKVPKKKVKTKKCVNFGNVAAGESVTKTLKFKAAKKFVARKFSVKAKLTVTAGSGASAVTAKHTVKLTKKK